MISRLYHAAPKPIYCSGPTSQLLQPDKSLNDKLQLAPFNGWYDLIVTVAGDRSFQYRLAGHVETGSDSTSDPALGGLVTLQG
jgi:phospholipase C